MTALLLSSDHSFGDCATATPHVHMSTGAIQNLQGRSVSLEHRVGSVHSPPPLPPCLLDAFHHKYERGNG